MSKVKEDHSPYTTTAHGMRGWFAVLMHWNEEDGPSKGFWEPMNTGRSYEQEGGAAAEAMDWAKAEGIRYGYDGITPGTFVKTHGIKI